MSGIFNTMLNFSRNFRSSLSDNPNSVIVLQSKDDYLTVPTLDREGCILLVGPKELARPEKEAVYEVLVQTENLSGPPAFSLFRMEDVSQAVMRFSSLKLVLPELLEVDTSLVSQSSLQSLSDELRLHPSMSSLHVAIQLNLVRVYSDPSIVSRYLNSRDDDGQTPLMVAIKKKNSAAVKLLVAKGADVRVADRQGNTAIHYAAVVGHDILVDVIADQSPEALNIFNQEGDTPLHLACKNDQPECVKALLCAGADVNIAGSHDHELAIEKAVQSASASCVREIIKMYPKQLETKDFKNGGTPLHWAKSRSILEALLDAGCFIEAKNFVGDTALHTMVRNERVDCVLCLLSHGANANSTDAQGQTPLHVACIVGDVFIVKILLVFDADTSLVDNAGKTAWQVAKDQTDSVLRAQLSFRDRKGVLMALFGVGACGSEQSDLFKREDFFQATYQSKRPRNQLDRVMSAQAKLGTVKADANGPHHRILCLDGGGIKGLVLIRMLRVLELRLKMPIIHCFDLICGTSTGAILALALVVGKSLMECQQIYFKLKDKVFINSRPYDSDAFEAVLKQQFGDLTMRDIDSAKKVLVTATLADRYPPEMLFFRNFPTAQEIMGVAEVTTPDLSNPYTEDWSSQPVWKAARASGAAPSFFKPIGNLVDGGIMSNNPCLDVLSEITEWNTAQRVAGHPQEIIQPSILVSLGTGVPLTKKANVVDIYRPDSVQGTLRLLMNYDGMGKLILERILNTDGSVVDHTRSWCQSINLPFYRLSPQLPVDVEIDEKDDKILIDMMWHTMVYMQCQPTELELLHLILQWSGSSAP